MNTQIDNLRNVMPLLPERDRDFAGSLINQYGRKGSLSDRQWPWVEKLIAKAQTPAPAPAPTAQVGEMSGLLALFERAKENGLKYPKISIDVDGSTVVLAMCGPSSQYAGSLNVTSPGSFDNRIWYGRVSPQGEMILSRKGVPDALVSTLALLAADPSKAGAAHGHRTGNCCFCARDLKTKRSLAVGYGPVCAEKWGLAW